MNILLLVDKNDIKKKFLNKNLVGRLIEQFRLSKHNFKIFTKYDEVKQKINKKYLLNVDTLEDALNIIRKDIENFVLITKIGVFNIDFEKLFIYHKGHGEDCTVVLRNLVSGKTTPVYKLDSQKYIECVNKKRYASCGVYVFKSNIRFENMKSLYSKISQLIDNKKIKAFIHTGYYSNKNLKLKDIEHKFKRRKYLNGKNISKKQDSKMRIKEKENKKEKNKK
jgi:hypothetical protein